MTFLDARLGEFDAVAITSVIELPRRATRELLPSWR